MEEYLPYATTARQVEALNAVIKTKSHRQAAKLLGISSQAVDGLVKRVLKNAGEGGYAPKQNLNHPVIPGFATKRVSTAYNKDGDIALQWHIQEAEKQSLEEIQQGLIEAFSELRGRYKTIPEPKNNNKDLASCYNIGDHHFGMYAWSDETGSDDYDTDIAEKLLISATQKLVARSPDSELGVLINLGDFLHANDSTSTTPASKHALDTDGRMGRVGRRAGLLLKSLIELMLIKHKRVLVINSRGNHDPDASMWLNEVLRAYFCNEKRVEIKDNYNKFVWFTFGRNLVVTHHGDKITWAKMHEAVTRNLSKEWGECRFRYGWTGHLHHESSKEIGGMKFERFGVLAPPDAWHSGSGYGSERTMTCIVLHKEKGRDTRLEVNVDEIEL